MARYESGMQVGGGYYWNASNWEVEVVPSEGGQLKGGTTARYVKVPFAALFVIVPLLGATFLMFLPLIGFILLAQAAAQPLVRIFRAQAQELAATVTPGWQPGEAHFTGKPAEQTGVEEKGPTARGDALDTLAAEIEQKRRNG